jgi:hypothetical protein
MSHHDSHGTDTTCNADHNQDSIIDAKSIVALICIVVLTVCFWLVGQ